MKKLFIILITSSMAMSIWGEVTAKCWITMTSDQGGTDKVKIYQDTETSDAFDNDADATKIWNTGNPSNVNIYCPMACGDLGTVRTNAIAGLPIDIKTNELSENYTFTFSNVLGTIILEDRLLHTYTTMTEDGTYPFTTDKSATIVGRFFIYKPGPYKVCATYDAVEIYENTGTDNIVITKMDGDTIKEVAPVGIFQVIDLSDEPSGHYVLTVNGTKYEFCNKPVSK